MFTQIPAGVRVHVSLDRYSQDLAYTFICKNEVSRGVCQAEAAELWAGWFEFNPTVRSEVIHVLLKRGQSASPEEAAEEMKERRSTVVSRCPGVAPYQFILPICYASFHQKHDIRVVYSPDIIDVRNGQLQLRFPSLPLNYISIIPSGKLATADPVTFATGSSCLSNRCICSVMYG
ncbi:hypothetical protein DY000_02008114 [Brassica cretica]|uniref:Uncharacterized protein n=1 Tax=Brassica cretica TaxID=69181 RepID=A0ABQ7CIA9_BRACR|nr:hypothetical protein DY000_02008114 [Brassica cretica]